MRRDRLASVYAARDPSGRWVSVWVARRDQVTRSPDSPERFAAELARVSAVTHPSLPALLAWDFEVDTPLIVSALEPGRSLRDIIASDAFVPVEDVVRVVQSLASALSALHAARPMLVHLGVCPERVLLRDDGRVWLEEASYLHAMLTSSLLSWPQVASYAQPGYALPTDLVHAFDPLADAYLLAVTAFEALTGQLPFGAAMPAELSELLRGDSLPTASTLRPGLPAEVDDVFFDAWRTGVGERNTTVESFSRDLCGILSQDRSRRPTFPGAIRADFGLHRGAHPIAPQVPTERPREIASAIDTVDRAFDEMLAPEAPKMPSRPPVIEFGPVDAAAPVVDVTPVKPTLVGATGVRLQTHPPPPNEPRPSVHDEPTPSMGYERAKILIDDSLRELAPREEEHPAALTVDVIVKGGSAVATSPDATAKIDEGILDALKKHTLASTRAPHDGTVAKPEAPKKTLRAKPHLPLPPESATRPSANPNPPPRKRGTGSEKPRPHDAPTTSHPPAAHEAHPTSQAIPPPPRLPDALTLVGHAAPPVKAADDAREPALETIPDELSGVTMLSTQDISEADLPLLAKPSHAPPPVPDEAVAVVPDELVEEATRPSADTTQITGTPLPPRPATPSVRPLAEGEHHPPPVPPAAKAASHRPPPPPEPKTQVFEPKTQVLEPKTQVLEPKTQVLAPPSSTTSQRAAAALGAVKQEPGERTSVTRVVRESVVPPDQLDPGWVIAVKWLSASTVIAAVLVVCGLLYLTSVQRELVLELQRERDRAPTPADAATAPAPDAPEAPDVLVAAAPDASEDAAPDASEDAAPDVTLAAAPDVPRATPDVTVTPQPAGNVPGDAVRARLSGQMRGAISDCVEGVEEARFVVVNVRYEANGAPSRIRLHGIFQEPPMAPCIEQAVREVRAPGFAAPFWEVEYRFPVPPPRWRPGAR